MKAAVARWTQLTSLRLSYEVHRKRVRGKPISWAVGPTEIAGIVRDIAFAVPRSYSALTSRHTMFGGGYDWLPPKRGPLGRRIADIFEGPWLLGRLAAQSCGVIYVGAGGFLWSVDRDVEYRFLKDHGVRIVCYFTGSDIRSPRLMQELEERTGEPNIATWLRTVAPGYMSDAFDAAKRRMGESATEYADLIFTAQNDQRGYLPDDVEPFLYFYPDEDFAETPLRTISAGERPVILHAPSSPVIKGTQLVRAAIAELRNEGWDFEYIELQDVTNAQVRSELRRAHIVLNEFYAFVPGVFAIEAMAAGCAVLTRAEEALEPQLPAGSNKAWYVTRHFEVTSHLRDLLSDHALISRYATAGRDWVRQHALASVSGAHFTDKLNNVLRSDAATKE